MKKSAKKELQDELEMIELEKIWQAEALKNETDSIEAHVIRRELGRLTSLSIQLSNRIANHH